MSAGKHAAGKGSGCKAGTDGLGCSDGTTAGGVGTVSIGSKRNLLTVAGTQRICGIRLNIIGSAGIQPGESGGVNARPCAIRRFSEER